jgi:hypothetical protein
MSTSLDDLRGIWEKEVLLQFAPDGGNREQALGYHLFSWEFCWQTQAALRAVGKHVSSSVEERLKRAAEFYLLLKVDEWDYGDSDNAFVTPFFADETKAAEQWRDWFLDATKSPAIKYWWGDLRSTKSAVQTSKSKSVDTASIVLPNSGSTIPTSGSRIPRSENWRILPDSGYAVYASPDWTLRWDLSPLGYLSTAAHGIGCLAFVDLVSRYCVRHSIPARVPITPMRPSRNRLASWEAHNGPHPPGSQLSQAAGDVSLGRAACDTPVKRGSSRRSDRRTYFARWSASTISEAIKSEGRLAGGRQLWPSDPNGNHDFAVRWQFPREQWWSEEQSAHSFCNGQGATLLIQVDETWSKVEPFIPTADQSLASGHAFHQLGDVPIAAVCSAAFRRIEVGPYLLLEGQASKAVRFKTEFLAG